ncbi:hypothetical protein KZO60_05865 [Prevotella nanceiensis]|nr:hypothetical protein [Hoylesella nanceiensis]
MDELPPPPSTDGCMVVAISTAPMTISTAAPAAELAPSATSSMAATIPSSVAEEPSPDWIQQCSVPAPCW